jgi:hypothetical protein
MAGAEGEEERYEFIGNLTRVVSFSKVCRWEEVERNVGGGLRVRRDSAKKTES